MHSSKRIVQMLARANAVAGVTRPEAAVRLDAGKVAAIDVVVLKSGASGHMGVNRLLQDYLRVVQFHNPALAINVTKVATESKEQRAQVPALVVFVDAAGKSVVLVDGRDKRLEAIWEEAMQQLTTLGAVEQVPVEEIPVLTTKE